MKLSILVTFYNEEKMVEKMHEALVKQLETMISASIADYELIYVNDGSHDKTLHLIKTIASHNHRVKFLSLSRNFGREGGILAGFTYSTGDAVMVMDGDLQHPPSLIPAFVQAYKEGFDIVSGQRNREGEKMTSTFFARAFYKLANYLMDVKLTDGKSEWRLLSRKAVNSFIALPEYNRFNKGLYEWIGFNEKVISYDNHIREAGDSKFNFKKSLNYAFQGILSFNDKPLRFCINLGFVSIGLAFLYLISEFVKYLMDTSRYTSGYFTTIAAIILFSGVQLISIGILGEYIGKIYYEVKRRPHFIVSDSNIKEAQKDGIG